MLTKADKDKDVHKEAADVNKEVLEVNNKGAHVNKEALAGSAAAEAPDSSHGPVKLVHKKSPPRKRQQK